jgi:hypothetical protein
LLLNTGGSVGRDEQRADNHTGNNRDNVVGNIRGPVLVLNNYGAITTELVQ